MSDLPTFFIRHTASCSMRKDLRDAFWKQGLIGIHFQDLKSTKSYRYKTPSAQKAMRALNSLAQHGGYVCATLHPYPGCMIGLVPPGSTIRIKVGKYSSGRPLVMKTLRLRDFKRLKPEYANRILIGWPRQGTIARWHRVGDRIARLVQGLDASKNVESLLPCEQEIMCSEFLRIRDARHHRLPRIACLTAPVGRTRVAVDISGITAQGKVVLAQVTHHHFRDSETRKKAQMLKQASSSKSKLVVFCQLDQRLKDGGITYFPLGKVYNIMMRNPVFSKALKASRL